MSAEIGQQASKRPFRSLWPCRNERLEPPSFKRAYQYAHARRESMASRGRSAQPVKSSCAKHSTASDAAILKTSVKPSATITTSHAGQSPWVSSIIAACRQDAARSPLRRRTPRLSAPIAPGRAARTHHAPPCRHHRSADAQLQQDGPCDPAPASRSRHHQRAGKHPTTERRDHHQQRTTQPLIPKPRHVSQRIDNAVTTIPRNPATPHPINPNAVTAIRSQARINPL